MLNFIATSILLQVVPVYAGLIREDESDGPCFGWGCSSKNSVAADLPDELPNHQLPERKNGVLARHNHHYKYTPERGTVTSNEGATADRRVMWVSESARGYNYNPANQDSFIAPQDKTDAKMLVFGALDGHGESGDKVAQYVAKALPKAIKSAIKEQQDIALSDPDPEQTWEASKTLPEELIEEAIKIAHKKVNDDMKVEAAEKGWFSWIGGGTTSSSVMLYGDDFGKMCTMNVGDSHTVHLSRPVGSNGGWLVESETLKHTMDKDPRTGAWVNKAEVDRINAHPHARFDNPSNPQYLESRSGGIAMTKSFADYGVPGSEPVPDVVHYDLESDRDHLIVSTSDGVGDVNVNNGSDIVADVIAKELANKSHGAELSQADIKRACSRVVRKSYDLWRTHVKSRSDDITCTIVYKKGGTAVTGAASATGVASAKGDQ